MKRQMPFQIDWFLEGRVLYISLSGEFTLNDFQSLHQRIAEGFLPDARPPVVHALFDLSHIEHVTFRLEDLIAQLNQFASTPEERRKFAGWRVYFGSDCPALRRTTSLIHDANNQSYVWLPEEKAALEFLMSVDDTLPDLSEF